MTMAQQIEETGIQKGMEKWMHCERLWRLLSRQSSSNNRRGFL
ncbi:hypothetical protein [Candidatus Hamiltonella defensa]|nr:hypothetical protein [Candidatus Hamiltonella defensa]